MYITITVITLWNIHQKPGSYGPETPGLSICHINVRSFAKSGRIDDLYEKLCILHEFDIFGASESHLHLSVPNYLVDLPNYNLCRRDGNRSGGGVSLYVRNTIITKHRQDLAQPNIEML